MVGYVTYLSCSKRYHWEGSRTFKLQTWICTKLSSFVLSCQSPGSFEFHRDPKWSRETGETTWLQSLLATAGMLSVQAGRWNPGYHYCASHSRRALGLWTKMTAHTLGYSPGPLICAPPQGKVALSLSFSPLVYLSLTFSSLSFFPSLLITGPPSSLIEILGFWFCNISWIVLKFLLLSAGLMALGELDQWASSLLGLGMWCPGHVHRGTCWLVTCYSKGHRSPRGSIPTKEVESCSGLEAVRKGSFCDGMVSGDCFCGRKVQARMKLCVESGSLPCHPLKRVHAHSCVYVHDHAHVHARVHVHVHICVWQNNTAGL